MNYLRLALEESVFSIGLSRPNPAVGAVVVKDGIVVGKGRTQRPGSAHAEVMALRDAGELARGAAIYVTLEPCCHYGRTPPCTKAIIDAGIAKVYYAHGDPNPVVRGNSRKILEDAGIEVYEGVDACIAAEVDDGWDDACAGGECHCLSGTDQREDFLTHTSVILSEAKDLATFSKAAVADEFFGNMANSIQRNASREASGRYVFHDIERYFEAYDYFVRNKRTFVEVKCAVSQEGFMGVVACDGSHLPVRITGDGANCWNHELRAISDAVLVGAGTVLADNPSLNVRNVAGNDPVKIVWAGHHEFSADEIATLKVFAPASLPEGNASRGGEGSCDVPVKRTLVFSCVPQSAIKSSDCAETILLTGASFAENWTLMVDELSSRGMHRLMVEPGAGLAQQLFAPRPSSGTLLMPDSPADLKVDELDNLKVDASGKSKVGASDKSKVDASDKLKVGELAEPQWNRLDIWRSTDTRIDDAFADLAASGNIKDGLEFPELPKNIVAKESFMAGPDVLTVYYPGL